VLNDVRAHLGSSETRHCLDSGFRYAEGAGPRISPVKTSPPARKQGTTTAVQPSWRYPRPIVHAKPFCFSGIIERRALLRFRYPGSGESDVENYPEVQNVRLHGVEEWGRLMFAISCAIQSDHFTQRKTVVHTLERAGMHLGGCVA